jgi:hypothetical protein
VVEPRPDALRVTHRMPEPGARGQAPTVSSPGTRDFGGTARVTYTGSNPEGGTNLFTVTVFVGGKDVAALNGSADSVEPGRAATVQLISQDKFIGGPYKFDFQKTCRRLDRSRRPPSRVSGEG